MGPFLLLAFAVLSCPVLCHVSCVCFMCPVSCALCPVSCVLCPVSCILSPVSCVLYPVSCVLFPVSCALYHVSGKKFCLEKNSKNYCSVNNRGREIKFAANFFSQKSNN